MAHLIKETTKEERKKIVNDALVMTMLGGTEPSRGATDLMERYIDGELELEEIEQIIIETYKNGGSV